jgi:hypothetical protein
MYGTSDFLILKLRVQKTVAWDGLVCYSIHSCVFQFCMKAGGLIAYDKSTQNLLLSANTLEE